MARYEGLSSDQAIKQLKGGPSYLANLDYRGALELLQEYGLDLFSETNKTLEGRQLVVSEIVARELPSWRLAAIRGRKWSRDGMDENTEQAMGWAGL